MVKASFKPVPPDQRIRELRKEFKDLGKAEPSAETTQRLAAFTRAAHDERMLNMVMHAGQRCLDEDSKAPAALVAAYTPASRDVEEQIRGWLDLVDLGRWLDRKDLQQLGQKEAEKTAREWVKKADAAEARHRLRTIGSALGREFADNLRDALR
ncbi:MAG: hypothetical protein R3249_08850 [Nitriliruptorales bacterium]|nr:hypothetical protein [Nitriliruptorales bacterium]